MKRSLLLFLPAVLFAGQARYARLGELEGKVEVQLRAGDAWIAAERNLPLVESAWLRTGASSRLEIELDEGSAWRLGPESQVEISDYTRLSTGQRVTVLSLDHGVAYFTGEPAAADTLTLAVPGAQVTLLRGARVRLQADATYSKLAVIEGVVRLFCPAAEIDIREGQTVRLEPANKARFWLDREVADMELDRWNEERDKILAAATAASHVTQHYGLADLDAAGVWVQTDLGAVWKPKVAEGWAPFQNGRWRWYDALGYTWVSDETWGWVPYHHGRWTRKGELGWVWAPATSTVFKPGDVYWLYNSKLAAWGPLAPGENWVPPAAPEQFLNVNTTYANFHQDARVIDPAGFQNRPKEPLSVAYFALALPSPAFPASRLEALRPVLRVGTTRVDAVVPGTTFPDSPEVAPPPPPEFTPPAPEPMPDPATSDAASDPGPYGPPMQVVYPVPVYTGIVVVNPPEHPDYSRRNPNAPSVRNTAATTTTTPAPVTPAATTPASRPAGGPTAPANRPASRPTPAPAPVPAPATTVPVPPMPPPPQHRREIPEPAPPARPVERPAPVPVPAGREVPRAPRVETKPNTPAPSKVEHKPEPKVDAKDSTPVKKP